MASYLKYKSPWIQLLTFGALVIGCAILGSAGILVIAKIYDVPLTSILSTSFAEPAMLKAAIAAQALLSLFTFLLPVLIFGYLSDARPLRYIGMKEPEPAVFWLLAIIMILGVTPLVGWLSEMNQHIHLPAAFKGTEERLRNVEAESDKLMEQFLTMKTPFDLAKMILVVAIIPAFAEEFFFRGVLQRLTIQITKRPWMGILIAAIVFSAMHGLYLGFIPRVLLGVLLGALYWYSGSLWPGILAHFINNGAQVLMVYYYPKYMNQDPVFPIWLVVGSAFLTGLILWFMKRKSLTHYGEVYDTDDEFVLHRRKDQIE